MRPLPHRTLLTLLLLGGITVACAEPNQPAPGAAPSAAAAAVAPSAADPHSYARPEEVAVTHLDLDLTVDFATHKLSGNATLDLDNRTGAQAVWLDTNGLTIDDVRLGGGGPASWQLAEPVEYLGQALRVSLPPGAKQITIRYSTRPEAEALQWLAPAQTAGGQHPFLFTQSQAILARTWIPLQDTPAVRFTYAATIRVPAELMAVMSAENVTARTADGVYHFEMPQAIPSYLMALGVGDLAFRATGPRTGVYAEPAVVDKAAWEFAETEQMIAAAEKLYGPYQWGRYDLLVLPPSFPFGGMENPRLTFATPTVLAGDRSLVALVAHELAHSWSGNLVTNANWNDFWLNEGFTVYFENRIMEEVYGRDYAEMLASLSLGELEQEVARLGATNPETQLHIDLAGKNPDDAVGPIAYEKGFFFLRTLEKLAGRERWDAFLKSYFSDNAFHSMTSERFVAILREKLPEAAQQVDIQAWVYGPGLPANLDRPQSAAFTKVEAELARWQAGTPARQLAAKDWSTHERLHFLRHLPAALTPEQLADLDGAFQLTTSGNSEVLAAWLEVAIKNRYHAADGALEHFLTTVGRRKFLRPLYAALAETPEGKEQARAIYAKARPGYHAVAVNTVDGILGWQADH